VGGSQDGKRFKRTKRLSRYPKAFATRKVPPLKLPAWPSGRHTDVRGNNRYGLFAGIPARWRILDRTAMIHVSFPGRL